MIAVPKKDRDSRKEYPSQLRVSTPVTFRGQDLEKQQFRELMAEWSQAQAEANYVETLEEANDFEIHDEEDDDFLHGYTVYEMHDETPQAAEAFEATDESPSTSGPLDSADEATAEDANPAPYSPDEAGGARGE